MKRPLMEWGMPQQSIKEIRERNSKNDRSSSSASSASSVSSASVVAVGLRILTQVSDATKPHIVVKSKATASLHHIKPRSQARSRSNPNLEYSCFLKTCSLCRKKLSPDQDIYMYRGDEGYCSVECRDRRIMMDEMEELEASTKRMGSSPRHCYSASLQSETRLLREELRRRQRHLIAQKTRTIVS